MPISASTTLAALLVGTASPAVLAEAAQAQTQTSAGPAQAAASQVTEVVVTAQKREQRLLDVSAPVTAIAAADLARTAAVRLEDLTSKTPGLNLISDREGETQIVLRGITTGDPVSSTVATYIDDVPYGSTTTEALGGFLSPDLDPSDLQRIEVLRGPQGTLYGASSLGGLIKYVTTPPDLSRYGGHIEADASAVDHGGRGFGLRGAVNLPIVEDVLGLRVSGYDRRDPGFIDNPTYGRHDLNYTLVDGGKISLLWRPSPRLAVTLSATIQDLKNKGSADEDVTVTGSSITPTAGDLQQLRFTAEPLDVRYRLYSATVDYDLQWATLVSVSSYSTLRQSAVTDTTTAFGGLVGDILGIPNFGASVGSDLHLHKFTQEVRLQSPEHQKLEWRVGFFYTRESSDRDEPSAQFDTSTGVPIALPFTLFFANLNSRYTEYAGFADATYHVSPHIDLSAGVRYSRNDQSFRDTSDGLLAGGASVLSQTSSDDSTTFQVTPTFRIDTNNNLYARVASGYRPGGPNAATISELAQGVPKQFMPDTLTDYEVGYKSSLFEHRLALDLSVFYIDWNDIQILTSFGGVTSEGNGGTAKSQGVEASAVLTPLSGLTLSGNLAYTDARLTEDAPGVSGHDGDRLPNVPKWSASVAGDYDFKLSGGLAAFVGGGIHYVGDRESGFVSGAPATFSRPRMPSYTTVELRAGVTYERYVLSVYAKNVGDERGFNNISSLSLNAYSSPYTASLIQPRTVGVSFSAKF